MRLLTLLVDTQDLALHRVRKSSHGQLDDLLDVRSNAGSRLLTEILPLQVFREDIVPHVGADGVLSREADLGRMHVAQELLAGFSVH